jgi:hypothetical protein
MDSEMSDTVPTAEHPKGALRFVLRDAVSNTIYFGVSTVAIIGIGRLSWWVGFVLACIESLLAAVQSFKVLLILGADLALFVLAMFGTPRPKVNEAELRWASLVRLVELGLWIGCVFILYRFFLG